MPDLRVPLISVPATTGLVWGDEAGALGDVPHELAKSTAATRTPLRLNQVCKALLEFPQSHVPDLERQLQIPGDVAGFLSKSWIRNLT